MYKISLIHHTVSTVILLLSMRAFGLQQNECAWLEFHNFQEDALSVFENSYINLTFWLNTTACKQSYTDYKIKVHTKTDVGSLENEGRLLQINGSCTVVLGKSVHCISPSGPAAFYRKINRSHVGIQWTWTWKNEETEELVTMTKALKLDVSYPPSVTNVTVDGQEVNDTYLISEGQHVNITCFFDKGNPPATFRLLDDKGNDLKSGNDKHLVHSLAPVRCNQTWQRVRCEAQGSTRNTSVTFRVKCPPRFAEMSPTVVFGKTDAVALNITAHSTSVNGCVLIPYLPTESSSKLVNCILRGNPPDLSLIFHLQKEDQWIEGNWTLIFNNEYGTSNTTIQFDKASLVADQKTVALTPVQIIVPLLGAVLIIAIVVYFAIQRLKIQKSDNGNNEDEVYGSARNVASTMEMASTSGRSNSDGLIYGDLDFTTKQTSDVIIGKVSETEYADINVTAIVPPPRDYKKKTNRRNKD